MLKVLSVVGDPYLADLRQVVVLARMGPYDEHRIQRFIIHQIGWFDEPRSIFRGCLVQNIEWKKIEIPIF